MRFYIASFNFVKPAKILIDDQIRTKQFGGKTVILLIIGEQERNGKPHICGFVSNEASLPTVVLSRIKENLDKLKSMGVEDRLIWIKNLADTPTIKIQKDKIVDRTVKDGPEPIHMYNRKELWS